MKPINYADEALLLWEEHRVLEELIRERTKANRDLATDRINSDLPNLGKLFKRNVLVALRLREINDKDILRKNLIDDDIFIRDKAQTLSNLALMMDHQATITPEQALEYAKKKRGQV